MVLKKFARALEEFGTYIDNNASGIVNYGERHRCGERISTGFVESTINQLVAKRFVKKQQMRWTPRGAHLLLQIRVQALNGDLHGGFERWYPGLCRKDSRPLAFHTPNFRVLPNMNKARYTLMCTALALTAVASAAGPSPIPVTDKSFGCISHLKPVRGFFVGSLTGNLAATLKVARSPNGGVYPAGSVIQLVPTEVMVKQPKGFNEITHDWEFFELNASKEGTSINKRGFAEVVNRFGGNCFGCHIKAEPKWDFVCETGHGCDPIPLTEPMLKALQHTDPRCAGSDNVSAEDAAALKQLQELTHPKNPADPKSG